MKLKYNITIRDKDHKLYKDSKGRPVTQNNIRVKECDITDEGFIERECYRLAETFEAICKDGTKIQIEVSTHNIDTQSYPRLYSLYFDEKRFVKHD